MTTIKINFSCRTLLNEYLTSPAMNFIEPIGEIHVGLGDGYRGNYNDYWSYNIEKDEWRQLDDFPSSQRRK